MMSIARRTLESVQQRSGGTVLASFLAVDEKGREWRRSGARFANEAAATIVSDAFDWTPQLKDADFADLLIWTEAPGKNDPDAFSLTDRDITLIEGEDFLYKHFAESVGDKAILLAWWLKGLNPPSINAIRDRAGLSVTDGDRVQDRAVALDDAEATFNDIVKIG